LTMLHKRHVWKNITDAKTTKQDGNTQSGGCRALQDLHTPHSRGNPPGPLEKCNYCEGDNRLWKKAKDQMCGATKRERQRERERELLTITPCQDNPCEEVQ